MRKLEGADFDVAASSRPSQSHFGEWWVGRYELNGDTIIDVSTKASQWRRYRPLEEASDLFFSFARLYEAENFADSALQWVSRYGLPVEFQYGDLHQKQSLSSILAFQHPLELAIEAREGQDYLEIVSRQKKSLKRRWIPVLTGYWEESRESPPSIAIEELRAEAHQAWDTLSHYEASINQQPQMALYLPNGDMNPTYSTYIDQHMWSRSDSESRTLDSIMGTARSRAEDRVTEKVNEHCYLRPLDKKYKDMSKSSWARSFRNLWGAMYLQMMWVMQRGAGVGRCRKCAKAFARKGPRGRKSPNRKMFCGDACRMAYNRARARLEEE